MKLQAWRLACMVNEVRLSFAGIYLHACMHHITPGIWQAATAAHAQATASTAAPLCLQDACGCLERCSKPVIAVVHGACVGAGMDLICAADLRVCAPEATFCVKEIDLAITADLGTLQRLPFIVGAGRASLMALTACNIAASTALSYGLVTGVLQAGDHVLEQGLQHAAAIAAKPRIAAMGTKRALLRARHEQSIEDGLTNVAQWNASMLWSNELQGVLSKMQKRSKL